MEKVTRKKEVFKSVQTKEVVDEIVFTTSDGREFIQGEKSYTEKNIFANAEEAAKLHQEKLNTMKAFKDAIKYKEVDMKTIPDLEYYEGRTHVRSFIFEHDGKRDLNFLRQFMDLPFPKTMIAGVFIVIQYETDVYNPNGADYTEYSGYFGLLNNYIEDLETEFLKATRIKEEF